MPPTLRRARRRDLSLTRSVFEAIRSKVFPVKPQSPVAQPSALQPLNLNTPRNTTLPKRVRFTSDPVIPIERPSARRRRRMHPIHSLPHELLAYIFVLGSETSVMFPVTVSHVCRVWRMVALRTPSLWRRISINVGREKMWIERMRRSGACTWDVELDSRSVPTLRFLDMRAVAWYMHFVTPYIYRWRSLSIYFEYAWYVPYIWNAALSDCCSSSDPRVCASALEELSLAYAHNDDTKEFTLFGGYAPRLRRVTVTGIRLTWLPSLYGRLTYLDYTHHRFTRGHAAIHELLCMLEVSTTLQELRVAFPWIGRDRTRPTRPPLRRVTLPSLAHLHLRVNGPDIPIEFYYLVTQLKTPILRSLQLLDFSNSRDPFSRLDSFFRSFVIPSSVVALRMENGWYNPQLTSWLMKTLPNIQQVIVKDPFAAERLFVQARRRTGSRADRVRQSALGRT